MHQTLWLTTVKNKSWIFEPCIHAYITIAIIILELLGQKNVTSWRQRFKI